MRRAPRARTPPRRHRVLRGSLGPTSEPFAEVLALGGHGRSARRAAALVLLMLGVGGLWALLASPLPVRPRQPRPRLLSATLLRPPPLSAMAPPPPAEPPRQRRRQVDPPAADTPQEPVPEPAPGPPPEELAQAGQVVAQAPDPAAALSPQDFSLVVGAGVPYVGGLTASTGTARRPVEGGGGGEGRGLGGRAREAWPRRVDWACDWPADAERVDRVATVRVRVAADGAVEHVEVLRAPTPQLTEVVRRCAMAERFHPARDASGRDVAATTRPLTIRFLRQ